MRRLLIPAVLMVVGLVGCTSTTTPSPAPAPTTPSDDGLYRQAETNFREFFKERDRVIASGGAAQASPRMKELAAGGFLEAQTKYPQKLKTSGHRATGEDKVLRTKPLDPKRFPGAVAGVHACVDSTGTSEFDTAGKRLFSGHMTEFFVYYRLENGKLKGFDGDSKAVQQCEI